MTKGTHRGTISEVSAATVTCGASNTLMSAASDAATEPCAFGLSLAQMSVELKEKAGLVTDLRMYVAVSVTCLKPSHHKHKPHLIITLNLYITFNQPQF